MGESLVAATYARVSTEEQDVEKQSQRVREYVGREFPEYTHKSYADIETGTSTTKRDQFNEMLSSLDEIDVVITVKADRIARSIRDLEDTIERFKTTETGLELIDQPISYDPRDEDPMSKAMLQMIGVFAELEASMIQERTKSAIRTMRDNGFKWGRPPLGFTKEDGNLYPDSDFDRVCSTLELVDKDELSQNKAAHQLNTSRTTIRRALNEEDRRELYNLPV